MRLPALLAVVLLAGVSLAAAAPPGYHAPRRYHTARGRTYTRPGLRLHLSGNLGYYNGDLTSRISDNTMQVGYGIGLTQALSPRLTFSTELSKVHLEAKDHNPDRGYRFENNNAVLTALLRFNLLEDKSMYTGLEQKHTPVIPFIEAGVGAMLYNPTAYAADGTQLRSETISGYPALGAMLPVGAGVTLRASSRLYFTVDALYFFTTTDLLDDISQRANPRTTDDFATLTLKAEYSFGKKKGRPLVHFD